MQIVSYGQGYLLEERAPEVLVGKLLTLIEAAGLPQSQEKSLKDLVKQSVYQVISSYGILIDSGTHTAARESVEKYIQQGGGFSGSSY